MGNDTVKPKKILYVDDEAMALKYFEKLVGSLASVLTAASVQEAKLLLDQRGNEIAVLVCDQRMPGARGNELLRYARDNHPSVVRMLTTAYSEMGEAIEAINSGEIYRYITKPWDLEILRADLRQALELAELRRERDGLLREKMLMAQQHLLGSRASQLVVVCTGYGCGRNSEHSLRTYLESAVAAGSCPSRIDWGAMDYADLMQAEGLRGRAIGQQMAQWQRVFGDDRSADAAIDVLIAAMPAWARREGQALRLSSHRQLFEVLEGGTTEPLRPDAVAWLAWLNWIDVPLTIAQQNSEWEVRIELAGSSWPALPDHWLADCVDRFGMLGVEV